ncbi:hypothetical protein AAF712_003459 [Marasmius tenuissimus]|uniref:Uncharacterized protein n=1 Tax=Marasmius tenuissimus TaxID=585030 RepID=A0ABR3A7Y4_9AGAR
MHDLICAPTPRSLNDTIFLFSYIGNLNTIRNCRISRVKGGLLASSETKVRTSVGCVSMDVDFDSNSRSLQLKTYLMEDDEDSLTTVIEETNDLHSPSRYLVNRFVDLPFSFPGLHFRIPVDEWVWRVRHTGPDQDNPKLLITDPSMPKWILLYVAYYPKTRHHEIIKPNSSGKLSSIADFERASPTQRDWANGFILSISPEAMEIQHFVELALTVVLIFVASSIGEMY